MRFAPAPSSLTYSERLASQDLQAAEIFEPGKSAGGARRRSDAVSSRRRRLSSDLIFIDARGRSDVDPAQVAVTSGT